MLNDGCIAATLTLILSIEQSSSDCWQIRRLRRQWLCSSHRHRLGGLLLRSRLWHWLGGLLLHSWLWRWLGGLLLRSSLWHWLGGLLLHMQLALALGRPAALQRALALQAFSLQPASALAEQPAAVQLALAPSLPAAVPSA